MQVSTALLVCTPTCYQQIQCWKKTTTTVLLLQVTTSQFVFTYYQHFCYQNILLPKRPITKMSGYRNVLLPKYMLPKRPLPKFPLPKCLYTLPNKVEPKQIISQLAGYHNSYSVHLAVKMMTYLESHHVI